MRSRARLLARFNDEQCFLAAVKMCGLEPGTRQRRAWRGQRGRAWEWWQALSRDQKLAALKGAGQKPHPTSELAAEALHS